MKTLLLILACMVLAGSTFAQQTKHTPKAKRLIYLMPTREQQSSIDSFKRKGFVVLDVVRAQTKASYYWVTFIKY